MEFKLPILQKNAAQNDHTAQEIMLLFNILITPGKMQRQQEWG